MKKLYEFTVQKKTVKRVEENTEDGVLVKNVPSTEDVHCFIKMPGRKEVEQMSVIESAEIGKALTAGCQSKGAMIRSILDQGGLSHAKTDLEELDRINPKLNAAKNAYQLAKAEGRETKEIEEEFYDLYARVQVMESKLLEVFQHTAEAIAEREVGVWAVLNLLFFETGEPVFEGLADETKKNNYFLAFDEPEKHQVQVDAFTTAFLILDGYLFKGITKENIENYAELVRGE